MVRDVTVFPGGAEEGGGKKKRRGIIHAADFTGGDDKASYVPAFEEEETILVELQYPSVTKPERFELVVPKKDDGFKPLEDIIQSTEHILRNYLPPSQKEALLDDSTGIVRRLKRAIFHRSAPNFRTVLAEFNEIISRAVRDGTVARTLDSTTALPLPLVNRILEQCYARTVSPRVESLTEYNAGSDNVFGELMPRFAHQIFADTGLKAEHVFVDLGSGVANVVLQAALQTGCEAVGIEVMPNPARLAERQLREFEPRCRRWGLKTGRVRLFEGDFLNCPELDAILQKADVVLVNNYVFSPATNEKLVIKFLDLKDGARVVSLKNFQKVGHRITVRNQEDPVNLLEVERKEYGSGCVSWVDRGGEYFVAVKDSGRVGRMLGR
ncbi:S-adenosyl-L-methionine-dependent methyltransferase [Lineolata rhizophorae]|uniref:Histone-lysine N-methyltransferase, H3 lysine-79 specific n=1 Tax=Lineolata rhizophorae TaxID=578093 RepID=A0A6A6NN66_9PEZI|nr:S-adenosyl-L-methionine-dependent methyltransferase [Lineolata rhizophorae]